MEFEHSEVTQQWIARLERFMEQHIYPLERSVYEWVNDPQNLWQPFPAVEELKAEARSAGLWNLFLPRDYGRFSPGLSNVEYAPLAERMGRVPWASEIFNCSAPDTGNMELLARYGDADQHRRWLQPLLDGEMRSAYVMTEPRVASSDATNLETTIELSADEYVINGRKWWISGYMHPRCELLLVMGKTSTEAPRHRQHSVIIVPRHTPGVTLVRTISVLGSRNSPWGEAELLFENVRVPTANLILGEGRGFEMAQGRLGPGRIHHCMRSIGQAQRCLELMAQRVTERTTFGRKLADHGAVRQDIALSYYEIEQARLLTLKAAHAIDRYGSKGARDLIAAIKVVAPRMAQRVADRAIQIHGAMGLSEDTPIADFFLRNRFLRIADGPDEVHLSQLGKLKIEELAGRP